MSRNLKQQQRAKDALEKRKAIRRLQKAGHILPADIPSADTNSNSHGDSYVASSSTGPSLANTNVMSNDNSLPQPVSNSVITSEMLHESMLISSIDRIGSVLARKYLPIPQQHTMQQPSTPWLYLPYIPLKRNVSWLTLRQQDYKAVMVTLTEELIAFASYVSLHPVEEACRKAMKQDVMDAIHCKLPNSIVRIFGSHELGLSVYFSDVDVSILGISLLPDDAPSSDIAGSPQPQAKLTVYASQELWPAGQCIDLTKDEMHLTKGGESSAGQKRKRTSDSSIASDSITRDVVEIIDSDNALSESEYNDAGLFNWVMDTRGDRSVDTEPGEVAPLGAASAISADVSAEISADTEIAEKSKRHLGSQIEESDLCVSPVVALSEGEYPSVQNNSEDEDELGSDSDCSSEYSGSSSGIGGADDLASSTTGKCSEYLLDESDSELEDHILSRDRRALSEDFDLNMKSTNKDIFLLDQSGPLSESSQAAMVGSFDNSAIEAKRRMKTVHILSDLFAHFRALAWIKEGELRKKARVPIINIVHDCGIQMDIGLGVSEQDTTDKIRKLYSIFPEAFHPLAAFLKVFLYLNGLDKVYSGGIGSYRIYVMIAFMLSKVSKATLSSDSFSGSTPLPDLGFVLLSFFKYFGNPANLNTGTVLVVDGVDASFDKAFKVEQCRMLFHKAYQVLFKRMQDLVGGKSGLENAKGKAHLLSNSVLGILIDTEKLKSDRDAYELDCGKYAIPTQQQRIDLANKIIAAVRNKLQDKYPLRPITIEDVQRNRPAIANRLLSYKSLESAMVNKHSDHGHHRQHHQSLPFKSDFGKTFNKKPRYGDFSFDDMIVSDIAERKKKRKRSFFDAQLDLYHKRGGRSAGNSKASNSNWHTLQNNLEVSKKSKSNKGKGSKGSSRRRTI